MKNLLILFLAACLAAAAATAQPSVTAFTGVHVLTLERDALLRDQTVIVRDGRIAEIGPAGGVTVPAGATRVDATAKFLMPAMGEMHAHIPSGVATDADIERTLFLYAANGIGTIRGMLGDPRHLTYRARVASGEIVGPTIYTSGPSLSGNSVPTVEAAVQAVVNQKAAGYDLLKIHPGIRREVFDALAAKANEVGIRYAGHVPLDVGLRRALDARFWSIDHLDGYVEALATNVTQSVQFGLNLVNTVDESLIPALVKETKAAGTWMVPTQILLENWLGDDEPETMAQWPEMKYTQPPGIVQKWIANKKNTIAKFPAEDRRKLLGLRRKLIKALHDGGVPFALGSDAPQTWNVPGFSAHRELQSMVTAGLTPYQALRMATADVATHFATSTTGTVTVGKRADLILLDANPLQHISNSTRIAGVMLNGRWMSKVEIDTRLASGK